MTITLTMEQVIFRLIAAVILIALHGFLVAGIARLLGDKGVGYDARVTPNPARHLDAIGAIVLVFFRAGWTKPVAIDPKELRIGRSGLVVTAVAALALTLAVVYLIMLLRPVVVASVGEPEITRTIIGILATLAEITAGLVLVNILPIPPLTGGLILQAVAPGLFRRIMARPFIPSVILAAAIVAGQSIILPPIRSLALILQGG